MQICPKCNSKIADNREFCPVCNQSLDAVTVAQMNSQKIHERDMRARRTRKMSIIGGITALVIILIATVITIPVYMIKTQRAENLYDKAYDTVYADPTDYEYDGEYIYVDNNMERTVKNAVDSSESIFVSRSVKQQIEKLDYIVKQYKMINEVYTMLGGNNWRGAKEIFNKADFGVLKWSERYSDLQKTFSRLEYKENKRSSAEQELQKLKSDASDTILSWRRTYNVDYYCGSVTSVIQNDDGITVMLDDYNNITHQIDFDYNYRGDNLQWNEGLNGIADDYSHTPTSMVMAIAVAKNAYGDENHGFQYIYLK